MAYRPFGNRCEGFYIARVSGITVNVASFTIGPFDFVRNAAEIVDISLPRHPGRPARIRAQAIPAGVYYRMDATLAAGQTLRWPIGDIIFPCTTDLSSDQLGIFAWIQTKDDNRIHLPVRALSGHLPSGKNETPILTLRVLQDICKFWWRRGPTTGEGKTGEWSETNKVIRAGHPITISFPETMTGLVELELVVMKLDSEDWSPPQFIELHFGNSIEEIDATQGLTTDTGGEDANEDS
jgi:hypothetical protein